MTQPPVIIRGRPDLENVGFGVTYATRFPPYVFATSANAKLVHHVATLELHWWEIGRNGHYLVRRPRPRLIAITICRQRFYFFETGRSQLCVLPHPDAVPCGRCQGAPPPFGSDATAAMTAAEERAAKRAAHRRLGCLVEGA